MPNTEYEYGDGSQVCMYVCIHVYMYAWMNAHTEYEYGDGSQVCVCAYVCTCIHVCMEWTRLQNSSMVMDSLCIYTCIHVCMHEYAYRV
jgi:hypothetical protein